MKSKANIGVGSILLDEATFLNPASSAFFKIGAIIIKNLKQSLSMEKNRNQALIYLLPQMPKEKWQDL